MGGYKSASATSVRWHCGSAWSTDRERVSDTMVHGIRIPWYRIERVARREVDRRQGRRKRQQIVSNTISIRTVSILALSMKRGKKASLMLL